MSWSILPKRATNLPNQMVPIAARPGAPIIDINVTLNRFSQITLDSGRGHFSEGLSGELLPLSACCFHALAKSTE